jgi:hypothetical protein
MASTTPIHSHSYPDRSVKEGSPDASANPSVANSDQQRRTSFNFLRKVSETVYHVHLGSPANVECEL